nr:DUF6113 family protein [Nocardioides insulae]
MAVALGLLPVGVGVGLATAVLHSLWWGFALGALVTGLMLRVAPAGWPRVAFGAGWVGTLVFFVAPRPEGDFLVSGDLLGYAYLATGLLVIIVTIGTLPRPGGSRVPAERS